MHPKDTKRLRILPLFVLSIVFHSRSYHIAHHVVAIFNLANVVGGKHGFWWYVSIIIVIQCL